MTKAALGVDKPAGHLIAEGLVLFSGWVAVESGDFSALRFSFGGAPVENVKLHARPDVAEHFPQMVTSGWTFWLNVDDRIVPTAGGGLALDVFRGEQQIATKPFRFDYGGRPPSERPLTMFLHIMKTGGTVVRNALQDRKSQMNMLAVDDEAFALPVKEATRLPEEAFKDFDLIYGHFHHKFREFKSRPTRSLTIFRNPFDYVQSQYFFQKYTIKNELLVQQESISAALASGVHFLDNYFCRILSGWNEKRAAEAETLARAKAVIDRDFEFVGLSEYMPDTLNVFSRYLGVALVGADERVNVTELTTERVHLDVADFRRRAAPNVRYDLELYDYVQEKFWGGGLVPWKGEAGISLPDPVAHSAGLHSPTKLEPIVRRA